MNLFKKRGDVIIHKHHRKSAVYEQGRYLHVDMKISLKSKRDQEIATETAEAILLAVLAAQDIEKPDLSTDTK